MNIASGTPVKLPDGRYGVVIPSAYRLSGRVRVKIQGGRKVWLEEDECVRAYGTDSRYEPQGFDIET